MQNSLALFDLISPYVLRGDTFGQWHAALAVLSVAEHTIVADDTGIVIRGTARFDTNVSPYIDPSSMTFGVTDDSQHPANDSGRRDPWFDIRDAHIDFELSAPRVASQKVATAVTAIGASSSFTSAAAVLNDYGVTTAGTIPSDYASTEFTLDLLLTTVVLRPPFLIGAKLDPSGILVADPTKAQVKISLPKIKARLTQGSGANDPLTATLLSFGASGLDDTDDIGVAQLITMDPPYAFIGSSKTVGIGFRSATLDLSDGSTPPDVLAQFGYDDSWTGLYLPELRLYIAPQGAENLAFDASATNLLIGFGASAGVTGDFELQIVDQGSGDVHVSARFYDDNGQSYGITKTGDGSTATVTLPKKTRMAVDIDGGLTPYTSSAQIGSAADAPGRTFDVDFGTDTSLTIILTAKGSQPGATPTKLTITAALQTTSATAPAGTTQTPGTPQAYIDSQTTTQGGSSVTTPTLRVVSQTSTQVTLAVDTDTATAANTQWSVGGTAQGTSATLTVDCNPGDSVSVEATLAGQAGVTSFTAYYRFDHPKPNVDNPATFTVVPDNTHTTPAPDQGVSSPWPGGSEVLTALTPVLDTLPAGTAVTVHGYASFETGDNPSTSGNDYRYNSQLALNRAQGFQSLIGQYHTKSFTFPDTSADMSNWTAQNDAAGRNNFWKAVATWPPTNAPDTVIDGTVKRNTVDNPTPPAIPDSPEAPKAPPPPSWFKSIDVKVRIVRDHFVACEIDGKFDIQTPSENALSQPGGPSSGQIPQWGDVGSQNPADGIVEATIIVQIDDATDIVDISGSFGADPADKDGLKMIGWLPPIPSPVPAVPGYGQNFMGLGIAFWPLIADVAGSVANDGALVELGVTAAGLGVVAGMAALGWFRVERIVWYGGEFDVQVRPDGTQVSILFDLEVGISADVAPGFIDILTIPRETPLTVRYKAVGILLGNPPGQPKFQFRPYFDSSKGYTIDVSKPGAIQVHSPFDKILKILGARLSRNNPFFVEIDLGFAVDLGVVTIDRARVRLNLSPGGPPEITAFGASVDIPGALRGQGSVSMGNDSSGNLVIAGSLDLTIVPVSVRIAATLEIAQIPPANGGPATGVKVTLEVDFPVAIPLGASGLGIYGFIGLFAVNFERDETPYANSSTPALAWLKAMGGDPTNNAGWVPKVNTWALGVGALLGTEGSDILFNLKGMFLLELPGPRLLLMMRANLLMPAPTPLKGNASGLFLAVIDLDFGRGTLTIGLSIQFEVDPLITINIPVEAFFNFNDTSDWHLYLGQYSNPVHALVLSVFDASGYLMLSGSGIPAHTGLSGGSLPAVTGFSIATGLHVSFTWGGGPLYAQIAGGFDAVVGFSPFRMAGTLTIRGTLHLFIINISAWADLNVDVGDDGQGGHIAEISGDICGKVDFLFFSISGCVSFSLGGDSIPAPPAPPLIKALKLVSRSPALVQGSGSSDKPIDSSLGDGLENDAASGAGDLGATPQLLTVPIDVVPALMMGQPPVAGGLQFNGKPVGGSSHAPASGWVQRGDMWFRYEVTGVQLIGGTSAGATPAVWWNTAQGDKALEAQLALMSWVPNPTPQAVGSSKYLDETTTETWGNVCSQAAPPAPVFWTFFFQPLGTSTHGWKPLGLAWPDPPNTVRSGPADTWLKVSERWRCGNVKIDNLTGVIPAEIEGAAVKCPGTGTTPAAGPAPVATTVPVSPATPTTPATSAKPVTLVPAPISKPFVLSPKTVITPAAIARLSSTGKVIVPAQAVDVVTSVNPVLALRGGQSIQPIDTTFALPPDQAVNRVLNGEAISRSTLANLFSKSAATTTPTATAPPQCFGWALASPLYDSGTPDELGMCPFPSQVKAGWAARKFQPGPFDNAVSFRFNSDFVYARFFMWVPERLLGSQSIVVAVTDLNDKIYSQHLVTGADHTAVSTLPASWTDPTSIWQTAVTVVEEEAALATQYTPVFVEVKGAPGASIVQIGCTKASEQLRGVFGLRPFYVGAIEALKTAEVTRSSYDTSQQTAKQGVLNDALGLNSADNALLLPNTTYGIKITYNSYSEQGDTEPTSLGTPLPVTQAFWFMTDSAAPAKLDPWVLVALPGEGEQHYFASEPVRVVFATNNVGLLYDTYGKKLQARLRPSSYVPPTTPPGVPHPLPLIDKYLKPVDGSIFSPWEGSVRKMMANSPCINSSGTTTRHSELTIPIPLDTFTDYKIDIEMLDKSAPDGSAGTLVWRGSFSTGAFGTEAEFANSFSTSKVNHRGVTSDNIGKLQAIGTQFATRAPQGPEFDSALIAAGLDALPVPKTPAFTVFWEPQSPSPQPVAVLVDSSEPMLRSRPIPTQMPPSGPEAAQWYEMQSTPWLQLAQHGGDSVVDHIVMAPGGQRALVTLQPASRGKHIVLALDHVAFPVSYLDGTGATDKFTSILDIIFNAAPWEEVD